MERNAMQTRVGEGIEPASAEARTETSQNNEEAPYWGVMCRTCKQLVAFDVCPYESFGPGAASMKPGAIRCSLGHNHIYFPRDFGFRTSAIPVADAVMRENRDVYRAINSQGTRSSHEFVHEAVAAQPEPEGGKSGDDSETGKTHPAKNGPDPRREAAREAANERWANWAKKKRA